MDKKDSSSSIPTTHRPRSDKAAEATRRIRDERTTSTKKASTTNLNLFKLVLKDKKIYKSSARFIQSLSSDAGRAAGGEDDETRSEWEPSR